jgi:hypothetical protein
MFGLFKKKTKEVEQDSSESTGGFEFVDDYLRKWNEFATKGTDWVPYINDNGERFQLELTDAFEKGDMRAVSRLVFFAVVRVGTLIPNDCKLGMCLQEVSKDDGIRLTTHGEDTGFFAADVYVWWEKNQSRFPEFGLLQEWAESDFGRNVVIPQYRRMAALPVQPGDVE